MLTVVIATHDSERALTRTLVVLVAGAVDGLVRDVIVTDAGSQDATATVADIAGARFVPMQASVGARLKAATALARGPWLLFLRPGLILDPAWVEEAGRFVRDTELDGRAERVAAVFRRGPTSGAARNSLLEFFALASVAFGALPHATQGLLLAKRHYDALGGHRVDHPDAETELLQRIGRRQIVTLRSAAVSVD